jgi:hypothetical protein
MKVTLAVLCVLGILSFSCGGREEEQERHRGKSTTIQQHRPEGRPEREKTEMEESSLDRKSLEDLRAELQDYLDFDKESEKEDIALQTMNKDEGDDRTAKEMERDEPAPKKGDDKLVELMGDKIDLMGEYDDEDKNDQVDSMEGDGEGSRDETFKMDHAKAQWCRCSGWKRYYYRERHYKNYYYRLYVKYLRYYRSYYRKYIAYYRYYHTCNRRYRLCRRKYHRLRQGYKSIVKSHAHLLRTCKYKG